MRYIHLECARILRRIVTPNASILEISSLNNSLSESLNPKNFELITNADPKVGGGISKDQNSICSTSESSKPQQANDNTYDYVLMYGTLEQVYDVHESLLRMRHFMNDRSRLVIVSHNRIWTPAIRLAEFIGIRSRSTIQNWIPNFEVRNLLEQSGFEVITTTTGVVLPIKIPILSRLINRYLPSLPCFRHFSAMTLTIARLSHSVNGPIVLNPSVSIIIAARNESGNIYELLERIPLMAMNQEVIIVEGNSSDDTWSKILEFISVKNGLSNGMRIIAKQQDGIGKGDAVRAGFDSATGDILMILDADISVPPEELPRFYEALTTGSCEFANGSRMIYPMEDDAMQFLNIIGNRFFGIVFSFLLGQSVRDTLCGTKVLWRSDYVKIVSNRSHFGDFDPFGDFDLLFGAARLNLRIRDVPVHYLQRKYGSTNISRFRHGVLLLRMTLIAARKLRFT